MAALRPPTRTRRQNVRAVPDGATSECRSKTWTMSRLHITTNTVVGWWRDMPPRRRVGLCLLPVVFVSGVVSPSRWGPMAFVLLLFGNQVIGGLANRRDLREAAGDPTEEANEEPYGRS